MKPIIQKIWMLMAMLCANLSASAYDFEVDGIYYNVISLDDMTCEVTSGDKRYEGDIVIPGKVTYNKREFSVIGISRWTFLWNKAIKSVVLSNSMTSIEDEAFLFCSSLESVEIPNSVTTIGGRAFQRCSSLKSITIPNSVTTIKFDTFDSCTSLVSIQLSNNLEAISCGLFSECRSLEALEIPGSVINISQSNSSASSVTFFKCLSLTRLSLLYSQDPLKAGYTNSSNIFYSGRWDDWTETIRELYINRTLEESIPVPNLEKLELGESIQKVQILDINKLKKLTKIESYAVVPPELPEMSNAHYINVDVLVPEEALEAYKAHPVWGKFWNLQASGVDDVKIESKKEIVGRYDMNGRAVSEDYQGLVIVRFSDGSTKKSLQ